MSSDRTGGFSGWCVTAAGFLSTMLITGSTAYAFGLFVIPVSSDLGLSRSEAYRGLMLMILSYAVWGPLVGQALDRRPARQVIYTGAALFAVGGVLLAAAPNGWAAAAAIFGPLGLGAVASGPLPANTLATRWFARRRGLVLGIVAVATSMGGFIVVRPLASLMEAVGWRATAALTAVASALVVALLARIFVVDRPSDLGQHPDGALGPSTAQAVADGRLWRVRELVREPNFWLISFGMGLLLGTDQAILGSMVPYAEGRGIGKAEAALIVTTLSGSAVAGKLLVGLLADRIDKRMLFLPVAAANLAFLAFMLTAPDYRSLIPVSAMLGIAVGGVQPVWTTLSAECFGQRSFGTAFGAMNLLTTTTAVFAIFIAGAVFDRFGRYDPAFQIFIGLDMLAVILILCVRPGHMRTERAPGGSPETA